MSPRTKIGAALTARQQQVLDAIVRHMTKTGRPPTYREIMAAVGIKSLNGIRGHLAALQAKGRVTIDHRQSRGIRLTGRGPVCRCCGRGGDA